jgi:hypothetical protein
MNQELSNGRPWSVGQDDAARANAVPRGRRRQGLEFGLLQNSTNAAGGDDEDKLVRVESVLW